MFQKYASAAISVCLLQSTVAEIPPESIQSEGSAEEEIGVKLEARGDDCARIKSAVCGAYRQMENDIFEPSCLGEQQLGRAPGGVRNQSSTAMQGLDFHKMQQNMKEYGSC